MTAHLALQKLPLRKRVRMAPYSAIPGESLLGVPAGTPISVRDLLYSLILAERQRLRPHPGPGDRRNPAALRGSDEPLGGGAGAVRHPLHEPDRPRLAGQLLQRPRSRDSRRPVARKPNLRPPRRLARAPSCAASIRRSTIGTRNTLLLREPWVTGVKTGHTLDAGYVLVGSGATQGSGADLGGAGRTQRGAARRGEPRPARLRLLPVSSAAPRARRRGHGQALDRATRAASCRCAPRTR